MQVCRPVRDLLPGDHAWFPFASEEEQGHVIGPWIEHGLEIRDKVIYITDAEPWELPGLYGRDLGFAVRQGLLSLIPLGEACLTQGMFDPQKYLATLNDEIAKAQEQEFRGIRLTAENSWIFDQPFGDSRVDFCEQRLDAAVAPSVSVTAICQTDVRRCGGGRFSLLDSHHEVRVLPNPDFDDPQLTITRTYQPLGLHLRGEIDVTRRLRFAEALGSLPPTTETVCLDLAEVTFVSLDAFGVITDFTRKRGPRCRVLLRHVDPAVRSIIDVVGLHRLPGIELGDG
ncbi:MEDS domain-containing protein [Actinocorallia sp. API 0066]|uniref:MEDS domain-containing protein n=1 Tax=Actinocorallia sp. API 0066 TaxID=2896846 RepID=UPI001E647909|nr:MEDS domain-containing protein [Actinocorallia sp. API 0066]MCD0451398.1 MEDS domain-containing protein [Actinocorallia sp. API 0066]